MANFGDDPTVPKVGQEESDTAEFEVALEDRTDPLDLFLLDEELLVPAHIAQRHHATHQ